MAYQGNPPYQGGPGGPGQPPYQGGPGGPGGPYQGGPGGGSYQGGPGGPYQGGPGGPYQGGPGGQPPYQGGPGGQPPYQGGPGGQPPYQGGPYQGGPYQGGPQYSGMPASSYADWIHRVGAYLVDVLPIIVVGFIFGAIHNGFLLVIFWLAALGYSIYNRWILGGQGQTLGKRVVGIRLVSEETGQPIGTLNAFLRDICHIVDGIICDIGYLFPLWDAKRQTLADKIMKTVVLPA